MVETTSILLAAIVALIATIFGIKRDKKKEKEQRPPKNKVADKAREISNEEFQKNLEAIKGDLEGKSPADDLASRGNARRR
jgi:hypothetical protein|tara:strand:- start:1018 stop:1260 length:243 start_codon:yes stop_codon:yes gene_type:complete